MDTMSIEKDPHGMDPHAPGAKLDSGKIRPTLIFRDMARALSAVAEVGTFGANKYSDGGWMYVPNAYDRYTDAMFRHYAKEASGEEFDKDSGILHQAHLAWNALARLELMLRQTGEAPMPAPEPYDPLRNVYGKVPAQEQRAQEVYEYAKRRSDEIQRGVSKQPCCPPPPFGSNAKMPPLPRRTMSFESPMEEFVAFIKGTN